MAAPIFNLLRVQPESGEVIGQATFTGAPRSFAVDSSGVVVAALYQQAPSPVGIRSLGLYSPAFEDRSFNSIRLLNRPLAFPSGGRQQGQQIVVGPTTFTLTPVILTALCETGSGAITINTMLVNFQSPQWQITVADINANASVNNISVSGGGAQMENPNAPGTYAFTVTINTNAQHVTWFWSPSASQWLLKSVVPAAGGGGSSIALDANNVAVTGSPFTTLDIESGQGSNLLGKGSFTAIPAQTKVVNGTPHTFTTDQIAYCQSSGGTTSVTMPSPASLSYATAFHGVGPTNGSGYWIRVVDDQNQSFTNPITVNASGAGDLVEDPANPGLFSATIPLAVNGAAITWAFDGTNWKIISKHYPTTVLTGDNIRGRRFATNKGASRLPVGTPNNDNVQSLASYAGITAPQDLTVMLEGNNGLVSPPPLPRFTRYIAVVDSSTATTCVTVLDTYLNPVGALPTSGNFFGAGTGWNTIGYIHAESQASPFSFYDRLVLGQIGGQHVGVIAVQTGQTTLYPTNAGGIVQSKVFSDGDHGYVLVNFSGLGQTFLYRHDEVPGAPGSFAATGNYNTTYAGNIVGDGVYLYVPGIATGTINRVGPNYWQPRISGGQQVVTYTFPLITAPITGMAYDGRYLWVAVGQGAYIIDPVNMALISQLGTRGPTGQNIAPLCWDGTHMWATSPGVASGTNNVFLFDPDQIESLGAGVVGVYSTLNNPKAIVSRVTPGGARIYIVCGDNTVQMLEGSSFPAEYGDLAGTLVNEYGNATVPSIGQIADIIPTETKFGFNTVNQVDGFTLPLTTVNATVTTIATIKVPISNPLRQLIDVSVSVMGVDSAATTLANSGFYRADFTFTALYDPASTGVQLYGSTGPQNVRNNGTAVTNSWAASIPTPLNDASGRVLIQVQGDPTDTVWWTVIGQVQRGH